VPRSSDTPLGEVTGSYFRAKHDLRPLSVRSYRLAFGRFMAFIPTATLADFTSDNVDLYLASIADRRTMAHNDCAALCSLASWLTAKKIVPTNPLSAITRPKAPKSRPRPHQDRDIPAILGAAGETKMGARDTAIIWLSLSCGARPNEIRQLKLDDLDLRAGFVHIRAETSKTPTEEGDRTIPLDPQAIAALEDYVEQYRPNGADSLFLTASGEAFSYLGFMQIHYRLRDRLRKRGVKGYTAYRNRHAAVTNFARVPGMSLADVQYLAGHKDATTTRKYMAARTPQQLRKLPSALTLAYGRITA
jgi:integrase